MAVVRLVLESIAYAIQRIDRCFLGASVMQASSSTNDNFTMGPESVLYPGSGLSVPISSLDSVNVQVIQALLGMIGSFVQDSKGNMSSLLSPEGSGSDGLSTGTSSGDSSVASTNNDLQDAMSQTQQKDPTLYAKTMKDAEDGDGNSLVEDELQAYREGDISKQQCTDEVSGAQSLANQNGGGKINGKVKSDAEQELGGTYIKGGETRVGHAILNAFKNFTPIGAIVKGVEGNSSKAQPESVIEAGQAVTEQATQKAMKDMEEADPQRAKEFLQDAQKGDGNAMVADEVQVNKEERSGQVPDAFTEQDAQILGSQVGVYGKGKVNSTEDQAFTQAFGTDTLYRGSTRGSKAFSKIENGVGSIEGAVVAPVTAGATEVDNLLHGNIDEAL